MVFKYNFFEALSLIHSRMNLSMFLKCRLTVEATIRLGIENNHTSRLYADLSSGCLNVHSNETGQICHKSNSSKTIHV
jgi:hypothetical protein